MTAQEYRPLIIRYRDGAPLRLQDVARISDGVEDVRNAGMSNGQPAILIMIRRSADANIIETVDRLRSDLPALQALLPGGVSSISPRIEPRPSAPPCARSNSRWLSPSPW